MPNASDRPRRPSGSSGARRPGAAAGSSSRGGTGRPARPARSSDGRPSRDGDPRRSGTGRPARDGDARGPRSSDGRPSRAPSARGGATGSRGTGSPASRRRDSFDDERGPGTRAGAPRRGPGPRRDERDVPPAQLQRERDDEFAKDRGWGNVARRGAVHLSSEGGTMEARSQQELPDDQRTSFVRTDAPTTARRSSSAAPKKPYSLPTEIAAEIRRNFDGTAYQRERMVMMMTKGAEAYDRHRYEEALRHAKIVAEHVPSVPAVRELAGLAAYRAERFPMARAHLRAYTDLTSDPEHLRLVMDCLRAIHKYKLVETTYEEFCAMEPTTDVATEGRIVMASSLADQKKYKESIDLLIRAGAGKILRNPSYRHVRLWYTLGDVLDRAGDIPGAREMFARVVVAEPEAYDAMSRLEDLGGLPRVQKNRKKRTAPVSKKKNVN